MRPPSFDEIHDVLNDAFWALEDCSERDGDIPFWNEEGAGYAATHDARILMEKLEPYLR